MEPAHLGWQSGVGAAVGVEPGGVVVLQVQHLLAVHRAPGRGGGHRPLVQHGAVILQEKGKQRNPRGLSLSVQTHGEAAVVMFDVCCGS